MTIMLDFNRFRLTLKPIRGLRQYSKPIRNNIFIPATRTPRSLGWNTGRVLHTPTLHNTSSRPRVHGLVAISLTGEHDGHKAAVRLVPHTSLWAPCIPTRRNLVRWFVVARTSPARGGILLCLFCSDINDMFDA